MVDYENLDLDKPQKSKLPIFIGAAILLGIVALVLVLFGGPSLTDAEKAEFETAKGLLRNDDYTEYPKATETLQKIVDKYPEWMEGVVWLGQTYLAWSDTLTAEAKLSESAAKRVQARMKDITAQMEAVKADPAKFKPLEAELQRLMPDFQSANQLYSTKVEEARQIREKGFEMVKRAHKLTKADALGQRLLADYYRLGERWKDVEETLEFVAKANPRSAGLRFIRGMVLKERDKDCPKAIEQFKEALHIDDKFNKARYFMGVCLAETGDTKAAKEVMELVLAQAPNHPAAKTYLKQLEAESAADAKAAELKTMLEATMDPNVAAPGGAAAAAPAAPAAEKK